MGDTQSTSLGGQLVAAYCRKVFQAGREEEGEKSDRAARAAILQGAAPATQYTTGAKSQVRANRRAARMMWTQRNASTTHQLWGGSKARLAELWKTAA